MRADQGRRSFSAQPSARHSRRRAVGLGGQVLDYQLPAILGEFRKRDTLPEVILAAHAGAGEVHRSTDRFPMLAESLRVEWGGVHGGVNEHPIAPVAVRLEIDRRVAVHGPVAVVVTPDESVARI